MSNVILHLELHELITAKDEPHSDTTVVNHGLYRFVNDEKGVFYALDIGSKGGYPPPLGGTNLCVLRVHLGDKESLVVNNEFEEIYIPPQLMTGSSDELFDYIASVLAKFIDAKSDSLYVYPVDKGIWGSLSLGEDVVELTKAIERVNLDMRVAALVNDTISTLAGGRYNDQDVVDDVILGTGTNATYMERAHIILKWHGLLPKSGEI
ncbi:Hexokinase-2 [Hibiscus syriacus]|uniref:Phosphotransferase n=1 Tax=Hibiscus syriacus TaxID=106335 RepID=A0A6A2Z814_HIBSY|nr:Hexokinase-2 [Hibiscus syriacus]